MSPEWNEFLLETARCFRNLVIFVAFLVLLQVLLGKGPKEALKKLLGALKLEFSTDLGKMNFGGSVLALLFCLLIPSITSLFGRVVDHSSAGSHPGDLTQLYFIFFLGFMSVSMGLVYFETRRRKLGE